MQQNHSGKRIEIGIRFIFHSSYLMELPEAYLLFDYYQGELPELDPAKPLYVLASHVHYDHFSAVIFQLVRKYSKVTYILSDDISEQLCRDAISEMGIESPEILWIRPGIEYTFPGIRIEAFGSTDQGVSFLVESGERTLFHAGDLNDWCWPNVQKSRNITMQRDYLTEVERLAKVLDGRTLDVACLAMDPALGGGQFQGPLEFLERIPVAHVYPMHMWERYSVGEEFLSEHPEYWGVFQPVRRAGEQFTLH